MKPKKPDVADRQFIVCSEIKCCFPLWKRLSFTYKLQAQPAHLCEQINGPGWEIAIGTPKIALFDVMS